MVSVGTYQAKTRLSELLDRVAAGEQVSITRHGREVARLVPPGEVASPNKSFAEKLEHWKLARRGMRLNGLNVRDLKNAGRR